MKTIDGVEIGPVINHLLLGERLPNHAGVILFLVLQSIYATRTVMPAGMLCVSVKDGDFLWRISPICEPGIIIL